MTQDKLTQDTLTYWYRLADTAPIDDALVSTLRNAVMLLCDALAAEQQKNEQLQQSWVTGLVQLLPNDAAAQATARLADENAKLRAKVDAQWAQLDSIAEYAAYYHSTWFLLFDSPDEHAMSFAEWYAREYPNEAQP